MSVPKPLLLTALKVGKLYFEEIKSGEPEYESNHIYIIKIEKIQLKQLIAFTYSSLKNYNIFSVITDFNNSQTYNVCCHESEFNFYKTCIQRRDKAIKHSFYKFEEEWFLRNKKKILSNVTSCSQIKKPFLEIFQEIEMEEK